MAEEEEKKEELDIIEELDFGSKGGPYARLSLYKSGHVGLCLVSEEGATCRVSHEPEGKALFEDAKKLLRRLEPDSQAQKVEH